MNERDREEDPGRRTFGGENQQGPKTSGGTSGGAQGGTNSSPPGVGPGNHAEDRRKGFRDDISAIEQRRIKARHRKDKEFWFGMGMMGIVGWSVAIPTVLGLALGIWLDRILEKSISFTLTGLFVGVVLGGINAWYWIQNERKDAEEDDE